MSEIAMHCLGRSHGDIDVNKMDTDMMQPLSVVNTLQGGKKKQKAKQPRQRNCWRDLVNTSCLLSAEN